MTSLNNKITIEGVEYTKKELKEIYKELLKPTPTIVEQSKTNFPAGKGLQFIADENLYKEIVKYMDKTFPNHKENLSAKLKFKGNVMKGSNPYIAVAVDMFLKQQNSKHRIATQKDLETNIQMFKDCYEDTGLVLRSLDEPNKTQAEYFHNQIKKANPNLKFPIFADLRNLELDANLNFNITPQSRHKTANCLNWKDGTHYLQTDDFGLPLAEDKSSSRQIWTMEKGFVGLFLGRGLDLGSSDGGLADSGGNGRVVLISAEGGTP